MTPRLADPPPIFVARFDYGGTAVVVSVQGGSVTIEKPHVKQDGTPVLDIVILPEHLWRCVASFVAQVRKTEEP